MKWRLLLRAGKTRPLPHRGISALDDVYFIAKITVHSGSDALAPFVCVVPLDTGSSQSFVSHDVLDDVLLVGAAYITCERRTAILDPVGGGSNLASLKTSTKIHLSTQFYPEDKPTCSLDVWACMVPPSRMQHEIPSGRATAG